MRKSLVSLMLLGLLVGVAQAADSSNGNDIGKVCTGFLYVTPKANDAKAQRWTGVTINSLLLAGAEGQKDILVGNDGAMAAGKTTKLEIQFVSGDLGKMVTISGLDPKSNTVSEKAMTLRDTLDKNGSITDSSCLLNSDNLLRSNGSSTPFDMDGCAQCYPG